ncbi:hypothetical protein TSAR_002907 [Trichomalopsis sarcophagae]|uniref:Uncharacterized protein n=1 Tax=Trichomalopsis sarcophagae TaxID=543379 RepID=A0A232F720_9HYME|nr:hypothetical protein TSAR_002907 [Trichomalopsis sarcophagae]
MILTLTRKNLATSDTPKSVNETGSSTQKTDDNSLVNTSTSAIDAATSSARKLILEAWNKIWTAKKTSKKT